MRFAEPWGWLALLVVPLIVCARYLAARHRARRLANAGDDALMDRWAPGGKRRAKLNQVATVFNIIGVCLVATALARPQFGMRTEVRKGRGMDIVIALDLSQSMMARDVVPSRLDRARVELSGLIDALRGERIGLVGFTSAAVPLCPLTTDHAALKLQLRAAVPEDVPVGGTSIAEAIEAAGKLLDSSPLESAKAILIVTDAESHEGDPIAAATAAAAEGKLIYLAGIGSSAGEPIPLVAEDGQLTGYLEDSRGQTVITRLDETLVTAIAEAASGVGTLPNKVGALNLGPIQQHLAGQQKAELEARTVRIYQERFQWPLVPGLLCLMVGFLLATLRRLPAPAVAVLALVFVGAGPFESEHPDVREGNNSLSSGNGEAAVEAYDRALTSLRGDPRLAFNRGLANAKQGELDAAIKDFEAAMASEDAGLRSRAAYSQGNAFRKKKSYPEALKAYRRAVIEDPTNAAARRNLELATAMKHIQDLQPKQENPESDDQEQGDDDKKSDDDKKNDDGKGDDRDAGPKDGSGDPAQGDGGNADDGNKPESSDAGQDPAEKENQGQDGGTPPDEEGSSPAGKDDEPPKEIDAQRVEELLEALENQEKALKRKRLLQRLGRPKVEKKW